MDHDIYIGSSDISEDEDAGAEDFDSDDEDARLAAEVDSMYNAYKEMRLTKKEQVKAKHEEWHGIQDEKDSDDSDSDLPQQQASDSDFSSDEEAAPEQEALSGKAALFFDQPLFKDLPIIPQAAPKKRKLAETDNVVSDEDIAGPASEDESAESQAEDDPDAAEKERYSNCTLHAMLL